MTGNDEIDEYLTQIRNYTDSTEDALEALVEYSNNPLKHYYLSQSTVLDTVANCKIYNDDSSTITYGTTFLLNLSNNRSRCYYIAHSHSVLEFLYNILVENFKNIPEKARSKAVKVLYNLASEPDSRLYVGRFPCMLYRLVSCWAGVYSRTRKVRVRAGKTVQELVKGSRALLETTVFGRKNLICVVEKIVWMLNEDEMVSYCLDVLLEMLKALEEHEFREMAAEAELVYVMTTMLECGKFEDDDNLEKAEKIWEVLLRRY